MVDNWVYVDTEFLRKIACTLPSSLTHLMHTTGYCTIWSFTSQWTPINTKYFFTSSWAWRKTIAYLETVTGKPHWREKLIIAS